MTLVSDTEPPTLVRLSAGPLVLVTRLWLTETPVTDVPARPPLVVSIAMPFTSEFVPSVTAPWTVAGPAVPIEGRTWVPVGGEIPKSESKVLVGAVAGWPMSQPPLLMAIPPA